MPPSLNLAVLLYLENNFGEAWKVFGMAAEYKALRMGDFNEYRIIDKERIE